MTRYIGGENVNITTDVVKCNIPMPISVKSMKRASMVWNFGDDTVVLNQWFLTWVRSNPRGSVSQFQEFGGK